MGSFIEEDQFFDSKEYMTPISDSGSEGPEISDSESRVVEDLVRNFGYEIWIRSPGTISERRQKLMKLMGLLPNPEPTEGDEGLQLFGELAETERIMEHGDAVLRSSCTNLSLSSQSSISCCSSETQELLDRVLDENLVYRIKNLDDGSEFIVDELGQDGLLRKLREVGSNRPVSVEEFERILGISPLVQRMMRRDVELEQVSKKPEVKRTKKGWLRRLGVVMHVTRTGTRNNHEGSGSFGRTSQGKTHSIRVRTYKKRSKEFSALYMVQDINGHKGAILTMKFSPDGQLLASAGEDGVVRIWQVIESEISDLSISDFDSSHVCFTINHLGELVPINFDKERRGRKMSLRRSSESACVIFPQKVFQLTKTPLHEFCGHQGEVLDLSWSNNKFLLSSSVDKTVRLWKVGFDQCLEVFSHNTFVTCIQFSPVDENYFISGSIDGKVRIWAIPGCEVVDWTNVKEIVTAVCYQPDGKGAVVGSISGDCYFYDISGNTLQMTEQTSLHGKKKTPCRRVTGFQFSPGDPSKLMVTTADSQVRILKRAKVICKYKGLRNGGSQISASFTSDGEHIISASEDSFVYVWNCERSEPPISSSIGCNKSCERFFSHNASVALSWCGPKPGSVLPCLLGTSSVKHSGIMVRYATENGGMEHENRTLGENLHHRVPLFSADAFSLGFSDPFGRGIATWPEEKLTSSNSLIVSPSASKSEYKFLKSSCQNMAGPHAWGSVIVTAGWDGRLRVFQNYGLPVRL